ncbi:MAG: hypothetical protein M3Y34_09255 [Actinomycetota bacterium]|nr:hypothetical protein [Actinomycetota bacterium]
MNQMQEDGGGEDPGLSEAPTGVPAPDTEDEPQGAPETEADDVNESHPNEADLEQATEESG